MVLLFSLSLHYLPLSSCLSLFIRFIYIFQLALDCHVDVDDGDRPPGANSRGRRRFFRAAAAWLPPVRRARRRAFLVCPHDGGSSCLALRCFVSSLGYVEELTFLRPNRRTEGASHLREARWRSALGGLSRRGDHEAACLSAGGCR